MIIMLLFGLFQLSGAGATFPAKLYKTWISDYFKTENIKITYQAVGSGKGIDLISKEKVSFGASDDPLPNKELDSLDLIQFPATIGAIVVIVNLSPIGDKQIKLSSEVLAEIFAGQIKFWNDDKILNLNPEINLPKKEIVLVCREDKSGTTAVFTRYLAENNRFFSKEVGIGKKVNWPRAVLADGNNGIIASISRIPFSIGYTESYLADINKLNTVILQNKNGQFVKAEKKTFKNALNNIEWSKNNHFNSWIADKDIEDAWPIMTASYIILSKNAKINNDVCRFFYWCFNYQYLSSDNLSFVLIPTNLQKLIFEYWKENEIIFNTL